MDDLTPAERELIAPYVTNLDSPIFCLRNLPPAVSGALLARYSRSAKPLRRLLIDEFMSVDAVPSAPIETQGVGEARAAQLLQVVVSQYGDDSVSALASATLCVEGASNILTKVLEWGRLASYLEQSTRYIDFSDKPGGRYRYFRPAEVMSDPDLARSYVATVDGLFTSYAALIGPMEEFIGANLPADPAVPAAARIRAIRARALDDLRGLLPAATTSNLGIHGSAQSFEALLIRLLTHPLAEARETGNAALREMRLVIPDFLTRVDRPDRGLVTGAHIHGTAADLAELSSELFAPEADTASSGGVRLLEWDHDAERRVATQALWPASGTSVANVRSRVSQMGEQEMDRVFRALIGERSDRRHKPGRALEQAVYTFEITCDYGAYRDLQRHRMLTLQVQPLDVALGYDTPAEVRDAGQAEAYERAQASAVDLHGILASRVPHAAPYAVTMAHRVRFTITINARAALHLIELRSQPQGHESYRRVAVQMLEAIENVAGHRRIAQMMSFTDRSLQMAGRLGAEVRQERRAAAKK